MAIVLKAVTHVWFAGRMIPPGEIFSADGDFGKKLIEGGSATVADAIIKTEQNEINLESTSEQDEEPDHDSESAPEQKPKTRSRRKVDEE
ncbi:hypothetical protein [Lysinibacillus sphaericus]|uniref:hypothetical protein n=1 Tax=Lysinibacillus sphaericus TaxID=1421 RepID=UPI00056B4F20|nr:hypothetical protein [Lysinibacillus sphaericus]